MIIRHELSHVIIIGIDKNELLNKCRLNIADVGPIIS